MTPSQIERRLIDDPLSVSRGTREAERISALILRAGGLYNYMLGAAALAKDGHHIAKTESRNHADN